MLCDLCRSSVNLGLHVVGCLKHTGRPPNQVTPENLLGKQRQMVPPPLTIPREVEPKGFRQLVFATCTRSNTLDHFVSPAQMHPEDKATEQISCPMVHERATRAHPSQDPDAADILHTSLGGARKRDAQGGSRKERLTKPSVLLHILILTKPPSQLGRHPLARTPQVSVRQALSQKRGGLMARACSWSQVDAGALKHSRGAVKRRTS